MKYHSCLKEKKRQQFNENREENDATESCGRLEHPDINYFLCVICGWFLQYDIKQRRRNGR
jgi:hypothetical protein